MTEERVTYEVIRQWIFNCYYTLCRSKVQSTEGWSAGESERGYAYYNLETAFDLPIERLMLLVLMLILDARRSPENVQINTYSAIDDILKNNDFEQMVAELPEDEKKEFLYDCKLVKIIPSQP